MHSLKKTGTDFSSANGMDPKAFFEVMGMSLCVCVLPVVDLLHFVGEIGLSDCISFDARAGGSAFALV
jgi:hypothetical protein